MLIGTVGREAEIRETNGTKVASFSLATNERYKDKNGEYQTITDWHNIVAWRGAAEVVEKYIRKGMQVYVEGKIRTRSWDDKDGIKRYVTEIIAESVQMLGKKEDSQQLAPQQRPQHTTPLIEGVVAMDDSDLPF